MKPRNRIPIPQPSSRGEPVKLFNIMLPIWLILFWPTLLWLVLIPANYFLDRIVLKWSLGDLPDKGSFCRRHTWKICLAGFLSDFVGVLILFGVFMASVGFDDSTSFGALLEDLAYGVGFNPFSHIGSFLIVVLAIVVAGLLIFLLDRKILKKAGLSAEQAKKSALRLALITAPYLYFIPSSFLYDNGNFIV